MRRRYFLQLTGGLVLTAVSLGCGNTSDSPVITEGGGGNAQPPATRLSQGLLLETHESGRLLELAPTQGTVKGYLADGTLAFTSTEAVNPYAAAIRRDGTGYILDIGSGEVVVLSPGGALVRRIDLGFVGRDLALGEGEIYVLDHVGRKIDVFSHDGRALRSLTIGSVESHFRALVLDPDGNLRVLESNPAQIQVLAPQTGQRLDLYAVDQGRAAIDLAVTPEGGTLVVDHLAYQILVFDARNEFVGAENVLDQNGRLAQPLRISRGANAQLFVSIREVA